MMMVMMMVNGDDGDVRPVLATGTRRSLEALRRRLQPASHFVASRADSSVSTSHQMALLLVDVELEIPRIVTRPSVEEAQSAVTRAAQTILATTEHVTPWQHFNRQQLQLQKVQAGVGDKLPMLLNSEYNHRFNRE